MLWFCFIYRYFVSFDCKKLSGWNLYGCSFQIDIYWLNKQNHCHTEKLPARKRIVEKLKTETRKTSEKKVIYFPRRKGKLDLQRQDGYYSRLKRVENGKRKSISKKWMNEPMNESGMNTSICSTKCIFVYTKCINESPSTTTMLRLIVKNFAQLSVLRLENQRAKWSFAHDTRHFRASVLYM